MPIDTTDIGPSEYLSPVQNIYVSIVASFAGEWGVWGGQAGATTNPV
jgi:hypothetical protein